MARSKTAQSSAGYRFARSVLRRDGGFTLVEVLVAMTLFMIVSGAAIWWLVETMKLTGTVRDQVTASNLASQELEKIRAERNAGQQLDSGVSSVTLHNMTFSVKSLLNPSSKSTCATGSSRQVTVVVSWPSSASAVSLTSELAC
jgi:prepilin-type N-terminal cleavage/methylation domain-containing protein